mmetsp:Transcript_99850/g.317002  ORF Transcript_99850/g.317002 Transcript_99850/m.317002 type:complete len:209 (+) Transcript_99850:1109-1735(+)
MPWPSAESLRPSLPVDLQELVWHVCVHELVRAGQQHIYLRAACIPRHDVIRGACSRCGTAGASTSSTSRLLTLLNNVPALWGLGGHHQTLPPRPPPPQGTLLAPRGGEHEESGGGSRRPGRSRGAPPEPLLPVSSPQRTRRRAGAPRPGRLPGGKPQMGEAVPNCGATSGKPRSLHISPVQCQAREAQGNWPPQCGEASKYPWWLRGC